MRFAYYILAFIIPAAVFAAWTTSCKYNYDCPSIMMDIACPTETMCGVVGGYSDTPFGLYISNESIDKFTRAEIPSGPLMMLSFDAYSNNVGAVAGIGIANMSSLQYTKDFKTLLPSKVKSMVVGQDIKTFASNDGKSFAFTGGVSMINNDSGVMVSNDGGVDYTIHKWPEAFSNFTLARYGSFPSSNTFFVTGGDWPASAEQYKEDNKNHCYRLSKVACVPAPKELSKQELRRFNRRTYTRGPSNDSGYKAIITKSSNGGKSWDAVYKSEEDFYFNDIACSDEKTCIAVGEGEEGYIFGTTDGQNFEKIFKLSEIIPGTGYKSLMRAAITSATDFWAFGSAQKGLALKGIVLHSSDAGKTWNIETEVDDLAVITGVNFVPGRPYGFAVGMTQDQSSVVIKYSP